VGDTPCTSGETVGCDDNCPTVANSEQTDADDDTVGDACDNCLNVQNATQTDGDEDGIGNFCDGDFDQSEFCNLTDVLWLLDAFGRNATDNSCPDVIGAPAGACERYDLTGEGAVINVSDLLMLLDPTMFGTPSSDHGCAPADDGSIHCPLP
jgi:hypothetical protein